MLKRTLKNGLLIALLSTAVVANVQAMTSYGPVKRGETLWSVAKKTRPKHVSVESQMKAIESINPKAFDSLNTGVLKSGAKLQVPSTAAEVKQALASKPQASKATATSAPTADQTSAAAPTAAAATDLTAEATPAATTPAAPVAPKYNKMNKPQLLAAIGQMQQQVQTAQQAQSAAQEQAQQTQQQLDQAQQRVIQLEQNVSQLQDQVSSFPWAWLWFVLFVLTGGTYMWKTGRFAKLKLNKGESEENPSDPKFVSLEEAVDASDEVDGAILANVMFAMADGDYKTAKSLLLQGISKEHDNLDLRMKLLEVYVQLNDRNAFNAESEYMLKHGLLRENDENWKAVRTMYLKKWVYDN